MKTTRLLTSLPGTLLLACAALSCGCASAFRGDLRGHHAGDYTALPAEFNFSGTAEIIEAGAAREGSRGVSAQHASAPEAARFEQGYQRRVDRLGSSGTAAKSCADFLAGCFGAR